jgi:hypothetical protein
MTTETATPVVETTSEAPSTPSRELNRFQDRCDQCGAQAFMIFVKEPQEFLFCGHHGREHEPTLAASGWTVFDHTNKINEKPSISATAN